MKEKIKKIIIEWQENFNAIIKNINDRRVSLHFTNEINTVIGLRRCGKTYILFAEIGKLLAAKTN
ncbi:MAG TPA: hypothetical protein PLM75_12195, partial [bacterium]|nr:hypothetical protein [bacterium]